MVTKGFADNITRPKKQLSKGLNIENKDFYELLHRTLNTEGASVYIWRTISPLTRASSMFSDLYTYEIKRLDITQEVIKVIEVLNDGIYLKIIGYIWEGSNATNVDINKLFNQEFLGIGIDLDMFARYVNKRLIHHGKYNIKKRRFYLLGNKRVK